MLGDSAEGNHVETLKNRESMRKDAIVPPRRRTYYSLGTRRFAHRLNAARKAEDGWSAQSS